MALPPPWIALYEAGLEDGHDAIISKVDASVLVDKLEAKGWRVVPNWAVDMDKLTTRSVGFVVDDLEKP